MNELDLVEIKEDRPMTTSIMIAEVFGKEHYNILAKIKENECNFNALNFKVVEYTDSKGETRPMYLLDRDFASFLIMSFTGKKAVEWKLKYIKAFNDMEQAIKSQASKLLPKTYKEALYQLIEQVEINDALLLENDKLQLDNKCLMGEILEWADRSRLNFGIRKLSNSINIQYGKVWNELYIQLKYKYSIDVKARGKSPFIQHIKESEWNKVLKVFSALCETNGFSPSDMLKESNEVE